MHIMMVIILTYNILCLKSITDMLNDLMKQLIIVSLEFL